MKSVNELMTEAIAALEQPGRPTREVEYPPTDISQIMSPKDGSFEPLAQEGTHLFAGCMPPLGIFVEFALLSSPDTLLQGFFGSLGELGPFLKQLGVFIVMTEDEHIGVFLPEQVCKWRHVINYDELTPKQREYTKKVIPYIWAGPIDCSEDEFKIDWHNHSQAAKRALLWTVVKEAHPELTPQECMAQFPNLVA